MFFEKVSLVTGGFDPIHSGHISYFKRAKDLSNYLIVGLNTEEWLIRKKGQYFQSWKERAEIIRHLNMVDAVISWDDTDDSARGAIRKCLEISKEVIFCNGGDRGSSTLPKSWDLLTMKELHLIWHRGTDKMTAALGFYMDTLTDNENY